MKKVTSCCLLLVTVIALRVVPTWSTDNCRHTSEAREIMERLQNNIHSQVPFAHNSRFASSLFSPIMGRCPDYAPLSDDINLQSLCPWEYYENHDEDRYPHNIIYANCTCASCLGNNYTCRPVYHSIPVIRQHCHNGDYNFLWDNEQIPVGCTCSHRGSRRKKWYFG